MAEVKSSGNSCPKCQYVYEHLPKAPDICTECGEIINEKALSEVFGPPEYLKFQLEDKQASIEAMAKPLAATDGHEGMTKEDFAQRVESHVEIELKTFLNTCSYVTLDAALTDVILHMQHLPQNVNIKRAELHKLAEKAKIIGEWGKFYEFYAKGGAVNYEYRAKTAQATELGAGGRDTINPHPERNID